MKTVKYKLSIEQFKQLPKKQFTICHNMFCSILAVLEIKDNLVLIEDSYGKRKIHIESILNSYHGLKFIR